MSADSGSYPTDQAPTGLVASRGDPERRPYQMMDDPQAQAEFMLPRLNDVQREFIARMEPHCRDQRVCKRDHAAVWPGVQTGEEWPDQFWFGGGHAHYPAGRPPIGNKRSSYGFHFNEAGLILRAAITAGARRGET